MAILLWQSMVFLCIEVETYKFYSFFSISSLGCYSNESEGDSVILVEYFMYFLLLTRLNERQLFFYPLRTCWWWWWSLLLWLLLDWFVYLCVLCACMNSNVIDVCLLFCYISYVTRSNNNNRWTSKEVDNNISCCPGWMVAPRYRIA